jgi:hypothetical protein
VPRRLFIVNVLVGVVACLLVGVLIRELATGRRLPPVPTPRASQSVLQGGGEPAGQPTPIATYNIIATKNIFNPGRSEVTEAAGVAPGPKPVLHGVVLDGDKSRAYMEEPPARNVFGYAVGDTIAGGRLHSIGIDRVVITRPEGPVEVLLQDPSKPKPAATEAAGPAGQRVRTTRERPPTPRQAQPQ